MPVKATDQEFWLGLIKILPPLFLPHKLRGLVQIPRALCLIEERDMFHRRLIWIDKALVAKVMHVLDERLDLTARPAKFEPFSLLFFASNLIPGQCLAQDCNKRPV